MTNANVDVFTCYRISYLHKLYTNVENLFLPCSQSHTFDLNNLVIRIKLPMGEYYVQSSDLQDKIQRSVEYNFITIEPTDQLLPLISWNTFYGSSYKCQMAQLKTISKLLCYHVSCIMYHVSCEH